MWIAYGGKIWFRDPVQVENRHKEILQIGVQRDACVVNTGQKLVPQATQAHALLPVLKCSLDRTVEWVSRILKS